MNAAILTERLSHIHVDELDRCISTSSSRSIAWSHCSNLQSRSGHISRPLTPVDDTTSSDSQPQGQSLQESSVTFIRRTANGHHGCQQSQSAGQFWSVIRVVAQMERWRLDNPFFRYIACCGTLQQRLRPRRFLPGLTRYNFLLPRAHS